MQLNPNKVEIIPKHRFRIAAFALTWLAINQCVQSSAVLAETLQINASFLRRVLFPFVQAGMVEAREGRDGGYVLKTDPTHITLAEIFLITNTETNSDLNPTDQDETCSLFDQVFEEITDEVEQQMLKSLQKYTLADIMGRMH
ncbi:MULTISPECIES: Rrf2 family transcriptional regulator [unclassified Paenibacillus]|uniref:RrF2 family transcriptional regulator n=1 Tax=Paenibacillus provencensis TaxID=441151 RepID=A0ABW3PRM0_9BACL|nr:MULTISPECIES: Rrf2 family transcriptional regulator [unclassified Paenibacillus]MCM3129527.1 Rrf2 family transcriptional regulator [Paenibacillus sp. MER 78]SFS52894.1 Rrf2 family protein [Paenibacillus sp. 453mf]